MSTPTTTQQLRSQVLGNLNVPIDTAAMLVKLIDIVDRQQEQIDRLEAIVDNQADRIRAIGSGLRRRANGVHGA